jgi:hypothetical protein
MTNDQLAALDRAATQGVWEIELDPYDKPFPGICPQGSPFDMACFTMGEDGDENLANAQLTVALVNAYRANQLVLIGTDAVEKVKAAAAAGRFLQEILDRTPNGEWIEVQYHPDGDWSVSHSPAVVKDAAYSAGLAEGVKLGIKAATKWAKNDAKLCDCSAYSEGECACGAWCDWKTVPMHRVIEAMEALSPAAIIAARTNPAPT